MLGLIYVAIHTDSRKRYRACSGCRSFFCSRGRRFCFRDRLSTSRKAGHHSMFGSVFCLGGLNSRTMIVHRKAFFVPERVPCLASNQSSKIVPCLCHQAEPRQELQLDTNSVFSTPPKHPCTIRISPFFYIDLAFSCFSQPAYLSLASVTFLLSASSRHDSTQFCCLDPTPPPG